MHKQERVKKTLKIFRKQKVMSIDKLALILKCSERTVQRRLKEWNVYSSYNQKGQYYVLPNVPKFDEYGLWKYKYAFFSKHGNLKKTLTYIVNQSKAGLNAFEMSDILGLTAHTFLSHYKDTTNIHREKYKGLYICFSKDPVIFEKQKKEREALIHSRATLDLPLDAEAVIILVALIKQPDKSINQLVRRVRRKGINVSIEKCRNLLIYHGLQKKTMDSVQSEA